MANKKTDDLRKTLFYKSENAGEVLKDAEIKKADKFCEDYKKFLDSSKTEREAVATVVKIAEANGYGVVYDFCGHGVGLEVHEDPSVPNCPFRGLNPRIREGMVLAIEPMINLGTDEVYVADDDWTVLTEDGLASAHEEHTVAVFADHTEILTDLNYK